jgi:hypothetical protein
MPLYIKSTWRTVRRTVQTAAPAVTQSLWRDLQRRTVRLEVSRPTVFYHIACMGSWAQVVVEQLDSLAGVGLQGTVTSAILGTPEQVQTCIDLASQRGITLRVGYSHPDLKQFEAPTLEAVRRWARNHRNGAALYLHTKGVSRPPGPGKKAWRQLMERHVIQCWRENMSMLKNVDAVGVGWYDDNPHFSGNFWLARADWLASLPPIGRYQQKYPDLKTLGCSWDRIACERWLGSRGGIRIVSLACRNKELWKDQVVTGILESAPATPVR